MKCQCLGQFLFKTLRRRGVVSGFMALVAHRNDIGDWELARADLSRAMTALFLRNKFRSGYSLRLGLISKYLNEYCEAPRVAEMFIGTRQKRSSYLRARSEVDSALETMSFLNNQTPSICLG